MTTTRELAPAAPADAARPVQARRRSAALVKAAAGPLLTALVSLAAAAQALRLWDWRPGIPLSLSGDAPHVLMQIQAVLEGHWYNINPRFGAPFGLNQAWFTTADVLNFATIRLIGLATNSAATAGTVFFVLGYVLSSLTAYWLARQLRMRRSASVVVGVLFSVLPNHQEWFGHLWLSAYWAVPLAVWLVVQVARGQSLWPRLEQLRAESLTRRSALASGIRTAGILVAVGLSDVYYVAFTLLLLSLVLLLRLFTGTRPKYLAGGIVSAAVIGGLCALSLTVATRTRSVDQITGRLPAQRVVGESETYAGKLIELLLPWHEHRAGPLRFLTMAYGVAAPASVERPALGLVAVVGIAAILGTIVSGLALGRRVPPTWGLLGALTLLCLAFYTRGGLGSVVALFLTPQIRTWSRFVVLIGLFGFLAVGLLLTAWGRRRGARAVRLLSAGAILVGVLDQTNPAAAPDYALLHAQRMELQEFTTTLGARLGPECAVLQLPVTSFPEEPPPGSMGDYDHLLLGIFSRSPLAWSYGGIRGTQRADWQLALPIGDQKRLLEDAAAAGFCAVEIDHDGYTASSDPSAVTEKLVGSPIAHASHQNLTAHDLRPLQQSLLASLGSDGLARRRDEVLHPVVASMDGSLVDTSDEVPFQFTGPAASVRISNMGSTPVDVDLSMEVSGVGDRARRVKLGGAGHAETDFTVTEDGGESVQLKLSVQPGLTALELTADGVPSLVPGTNGRQFAVLKVSSLKVSASSVGVNAASLQQFAHASPKSIR